MYQNLGRRTPASEYGLKILASVQKVLVTLARTGIFQTGGVCYVAARASVAPAKLRFVSATAAGTLPMAMFPCYSKSETVHCMGTSYVGVDR